MKTNRLLITLLLVAMTVQVALADEIKIVGQNVQNFFYSLDDSRTQTNSIPISNYNTEAGRTAKLNAIIEKLSVYSADIYAFNEVECHPEVLKLLAQAMSTATGKTYQAVNDNLTADAGYIKSGFIYNTATIETLGSNVSTAVGYTYTYPYQMRMQAFKSKASGESFTLSMNHFKATTSDDPSYDINQRENNSIALLKGLDQATLDPDILVMGDLNAVMGEQCLNNLVDVGFEEQILKRDPYAYSHWFSNSGSLIDHVFANSTMAVQVTDAYVDYVANPHSTGSNAYSDHDPYVVTLNLQAQPDPAYGYERVTEMQVGVPYLMVVSLNSQLNAAKPVPADKSYAYQLTTVVTEDNGVISMPDAKSAFIFEEDGSGNYLMKDYYGRYIYQYYANSKYNTNTSVGNKSYANSFSVIPQPDGTFKILNTVSNCYFQGLIYNSAGEFALYDQARNNRYMPWLYGFKSIITAITTVTSYSQPTITRKVMENGRLVIMTPDGKRYTLQGIEQR